MLGSLRRATVVTMVVSLGCLAPCAATQAAGKAPTSGRQKLHHVQPFSKHPRGKLPHEACPPATVSRASCLAAVVPSKADGSPKLEVDLEGSGVGGGLSPADLQDAYKLSTLPEYPAPRIAIVDAYDNPNAAADLRQYQSYYNLPHSTLLKVNQYGSSQLSSLPESEEYWGLEIALDLDMAASACPYCEILLVEADSNSFEDLETANETAAELGAVVISDSWGNKEFAGETEHNSKYELGVPIFVSSGDSGYRVSNPASQPGVIAVGGTTLHKAQSARGWTETAWSGAGSGCSAFQAKPNWQTDTSCAKRSVADVAAVADPASAVSVYDTFGYGGGGWFLVGGTSAAAPLLAGVEARLTATERAKQAELFWEKGPEGTLFDVADGRNGGCAPEPEYLCDARVGYDGPTGWGTPGGSRPAPPVAGTYPAVEANATEATLRGGVNPNGEATTYSFEYGTTTAYGSSSPAEGAGEGTSPVEFSTTISGLAPYSDYHFRIAATNSMGTTYGADEVFQTSPWTLQAGVQTFHAEEKPGWRWPRLTDISCSSTTDCVAVGWELIPLGELGSHGAFLEHWDGTDWTAEAIPAPQEPIAGKVELNGVSCTSATSCVAVGTAYDSPTGENTGYTPFVEHWNGSTWSLERPPLPSDAEATEAGQYTVLLKGVSCVSSTSCVAVGYYRTTGSRYFTLVESWDGSNWTVEASPSPEEGPQKYPVIYNRLLDVSCVSSNSCVAVGSSGPFWNYDTKTLIERWNGSEWSEESTPNVPELGDRLTGVSCTSTNACMAVGQTFKEEEVEAWWGGQEKGEVPGPLAEEWNGTSWTFQTPGRPMEDVSCIAVNWCVGVGESYEVAENNHPVLREGGTQHWDGSTWTSIDPPSPHDSFIEEQRFVGVSCQSRSCETIGRYHGSNGLEPTLIAGLTSFPANATTEPASAIGASGATLHGSVVPDGYDTAYQFEYGTTTGYGSTAPVTPKEIGPGFGAIEVSQPLEGLSPATTYHYRVVATNSAEETVHGEDQTFTTWGDWSAQPTPNVLQSAPETELEAVSCPSAEMCMAAGQDLYAAAGQATGQLWEGGEWQTLFEGIEATVAAIDCPTASLCIVVGEDSEGNPWNERWRKSGETWSKVGRFLAAPAGGSELKLRDVSCTSDSACTLVGSYYDGSHTQPLVETWSGGLAWSVQGTPEIEGEAGELSGVSCESASSCVAVGTRGAGAGTLAERFDGASWSLLASQDPEAEGATKIALEDVSCASGGFCMAVGSYKEGYERWAFSESFDGSAWTLRGAPAPEGSKSDSLLGVSCASASACSAVGRYVISSTTGEFGVREEGTMALSWGGSEWQLQSSPNPEGSKLSRLADVECSAATACTAVGRAKKEKSAAETATLAERYE